MVIGFLKSPITVSKETYGDSNAKEKIIIGGAYFVVLFRSFGL